MNVKRGRSCGSKRVSNRKKNSWRRVDGSALEDYYDDKLLQERLGTDFENRPDEELFIIDTKPSDSSTNNTRRLTRIQRRKLVLQTEPGCFRALVNTSKVSDPSGKRNHTKPVTLSQRTIQKKEKRGITQRKLNSAKISRELHKKRLATAKISCTEFTRDLWTDDDKCNKNEPVKEWLSRDSILCNKLNAGVRKPPPMKIKIPSIPAPHEGTSYNPTFKAHQELLNTVLDSELKVIKEEKHLEKVTSKMFRKVTPAELEKENLEQLRQGLDEKSSDDEEDDGEYKPINPPVLRRKKDLKTKRHIKEHKLEKAMAKEKAMEKKKLSDIYKLRFIKNAVAKQETEQETNKLKRIVKKANTVKTPQISSRPFEEPPATFQTPDDLSGNLRNLKPQGGGLPDHFASLQRRGIASMSVPKINKKAPKKKYTLASHRMPWQQIERPVKSAKKVKK